MSLSLDRTLDRCHALQVLAGRFKWLDPDAIVPRRDPASGGDPSRPFGPDGRLERRLLITPRGAGGERMTLRAPPHRVAAVVRFPLALLAFGPGRT
jgi:hypothetical protein